MDGLKKKRTTAKSAITRLETFVNTYENVNTIDINEFCTRETHLLKAFEDYCAIQTEIEDIDDAEEADRDNIESQYFRVLAKIKTIVQKRSNIVVNVNNSDLQQPVPQTQSDPTSRVKLPSLNTPSFSGKYEDWKSFIDLFTALIDDSTQLTNVQKFLYLKGALSNEALNLVNDLALTYDNYPLALDLLKKRYDNNLVIVNTHIKCLLDTPLVTRGDGAQLRAFLTCIRQHLNSLRALKLPVDSWDVLLVYIFLRKLDFESHRAYELEKDNAALPTLSSFLEFIENRCCAFENIFGSDNNKCFKPKQLRSALVTTQRDSRGDSKNKIQKYCRSSRCSRLALLTTISILLSSFDPILSNKPLLDQRSALHIGGIFPIAGEGGWQGGQACMPAARLALEDVNARKDLLPGYVLKMYSNDSKCEPGLGASVIYNLLYNEPTKLMLLAGCSTVCTMVAEAAKMWNLVVLCYGASSPALSDRNRFPTLFRTHPSATVHNPTRIKLMKKFGWSRVAILQEAEEVFISTVEDLERRCLEAGIEIVTRQSFLSDPSDAVKNLKRQDSRVIVGLFYVVAARRVLCELYKQNLYGKQYTWFFIGWYEDNWFEVVIEKEGIECTVEQMRVAAEGHITTEAVMWNTNVNERTISGMTSSDFKKRLNNVLSDEGYDIINQRYPEGYQEAPLAYDAVWSVALAFNKTMDRLHKFGKSLKDFNYNNKEIADEIYSAMNSTQFLGISGIVAFSSQGDRIALTQIEQVINGSYTVLGYYDTQTDNLTWNDKEVWQGGKVPQDRTIIRSELRTVSLPLFICMCIISALGIIVAAVLIGFNIWNKHRRVIQSSHPVCNTIMLFGIIVCLAAVFLLGLDGRFVSPDVYPAICQSRAWLLATGFTLSFGAMFSKVWRVHRLTTKAKSDPKVRMKKVQPWKLYSMVTGLLVIDFIIMLTWQLLDPLQRRIETFPLEAPISALDDAQIRPELEHCESHNNNVWLSIMYAYKGLVLIFGLFLAYETRSLKVKQINDSRYVGMSIYNVVILCLITAPVTMVIASQQDASYAFEALAIVFCCFLSMALIFVPKVIEVIRHPRDKAESKYNPDMGVSKEDEEKYQKMLIENEDLQRLIAQKEEKIKLLKEKLAIKESKGGLLVPPSTITQDTNDERI